MLNHPTMPKVRRFTEEEDRFIRTCCALGLFASACARDLGRTRNSILGRAFRLGVNFPNTTRRRPISLP